MKLRRALAAVDKIQAMELVQGTPGAHNAKLNPFWDFHVSRMDEIIFQEFKGNRRIFPCINPRAVAMIVSEKAGESTRM